MQKLCDFRAKATESSSPNELYPKNKPTFSKPLMVERVGRKYQNFLAGILRCVAWTGKSATFGELMTKNGDRPREIDLFDRQKSSIIHIFSAITHG